MFLHLGSDYVIPLKSIVAITDMNAVKATINQEFIDEKRQQHLVVDIAKGQAKSLVITDKKVYLSAISAVTLKKRAGFILESEEVEATDIQEE